MEQRNVLALIVITRNGRHADRIGEVAGGGLVAHHPHGLRGGADEDDARLGARFGERRVLREQPVAGVQGFGATIHRGLNDGVDAQVAFAGWGGTDVDCAVGLEDVKRATVCVGVDGDCLDAEIAVGTHYAHGDLPAVRDEDA